MNNTNEARRTAEALDTRRLWCYTEARGALVGSAEWRMADEVL